MARIIEIVHQPQLLTNETNTNVPCIGNDVPVWTKEALFEALSNIMEEYNLEMKEVDLVPSFR